MRRAYIVHAAGKLATKDEKPERSFFSIQYRVAGTQHIRYIDEFCKLEFYEGIKNDPLNSTLPDEKRVIADTAGLAGGLQRQSTVSLKK
jgi:hypothetical protein